MFWNQFTFLCSGWWHSLDGQGLCDAWDRCCGLLQRWRALVGPGSAAEAQSCQRHPHVWGWFTGTELTLVLYFTHNVWCHTYPSMHCCIWNCAFSNQLNQLPLEMFRYRFFFSVLIPILIPGLRVSADTNVFCFFFFHPLSFSTLFAVLRKTAKTLDLEMFSISSFFSC